MVSLSMTTQAMTIKATQTKCYNGKCKEYGTTNFLPYYRTYNQYSDEALVEDALKVDAGEQASEVFDSIADDLGISSKELSMEILDQ